MKLEDFKKIISKIEKNDVKGLDVQKELAPINRINELKKEKKGTVRNASVMALVYPKEQIMHLALIVRTEYDGKHSGQIALPGGKRELDDLNDWSTALREVEEEIGIVSVEIKLLKELTCLYVPVSNFKVHPFLAMSEKELIFKLQESEVADLIEMPLDYFIFESNVKQINVKSNNNNTIDVPGFIYEKYKIWGATAMILNELKTLFIDSMEL